MGFLVILDIRAFVHSVFSSRRRGSRSFTAAPYVDPQALLKRTGAVWVAFTLLQLIAFFRWEKAPWWLVLIAGVRLTELFSDWTYMWLASSMTHAREASDFSSRLAGNLAFGIFPHLGL